MAFEKLDSSDITAIAATVAALAAVGVSIWDNVQQRRFYRVSVMPQLDYAPRKVGAVEGEVRLTNKGTGPAEIRAVRIGFCGNEQPRSFASWNEARSAIRELGLIVTGYHDLRQDELVGTGASIAWLRVESRDSIATGDPVQALIDALAFRIEYASIYGEAFELVRRADCLASAREPDG